MKIFPLCLYKDMHININTHYIHIYKHISTYIYIIHIHFTYTIVYVTSVQFSCTAVSNSLQPHGLQHPRPPCPSPPPGACLLNRDAIQPSHHLSFSSPPCFTLSSIRIFSKESLFCIRWPKYWSFSFNISPSSEYSGLIPFRIDWLDLSPVQETFKSLIQHYISKASILRCSAFFIVQLSHPYMITGKTIPLTRWKLVGKVMSLLLNMLSRLVIASILRSKHLLILWLQSPLAVILEPPQNKSLSLFPFFPHLFAMQWLELMP